MTAVILSLILTGLAASVSSGGFLSRADAANSEYKRVSLGLAESCVNAALLKIRQGYSYAPPSGGEVITVGDESCTILSVTYVNNAAAHMKTAEITTQANYRGSWSDMKVSAIVSDPTFSPVTRGNINVVTHVINNDGGTSTANMFTMEVSGTNPSQSSFLGSESGVSVSLDTGSYDVRPLIASVPGYSITRTGGCIGTISASQSVPCKLIYDDVPNKVSLAVTVIGGPNPLPPNLLTLTTSTTTLTLTSTSSQSRTFSVGGPTTFQLNANSIGGWSLTPWSSGCSGPFVLKPGDATKVCAIAYTLPPPVVQPNSDVVIMFDRTLSMYSGSTPTPVEQEAVAVKKLLDMFKTYPTQGYLLPYIGLGSFVGLTSAVPNVDPQGYITNDYGADATTTVIGPMGPNGFGLSTWQNPGSASSSDGVFATAATEGLTQLYKNFNLSPAVPATTTITTVDVEVRAQISGTTQRTSGNLYPFAQGSQTGWTNGFSTVNETGTPNCSTANSLITSTANARESVTIDLSTIPPDAIINSVAINVYDKADSTSGGTYKSFARVNGVITDATSTLLSNTVNGTNVCNSAKSQLIDITDIAKASVTSLEIGVLKQNNGGATNNAVRIGAFNAIINYTVPATGSLGISLWNANSNSWTATTTISSITATASTSKITGTWGKTWRASDFADGTFQLRVADTASTGPIMSLDSISVKIGYNTPASGLYRLIDLFTASHSFANEATLIDKAIAAGQKELVDHGDAVRPNSLILLSDGDPPGGVSYTGRCGPTSEPVQCPQARELALLEADTAKRAGTSIFTIHFGPDIANFGGQELMAAISSGTTTATSSTATIVSSNGAVRSGNIVTITTTAAHPFAIGQNVRIAGVSNPLFNGNFVIASIPSSTKFTYAMTTSGAATGNNGIVTPVHEQSSADDQPNTTAGYTAENIDADNFFISPDTSTLDLAFKKAGSAAAGGGPPTTPVLPPTLLVVTYVFNDDVPGGKLPSDFQMSITDNTTTMTPFAGSESGVVVTLAPGTHAYTVSDTGHNGYIDPPTRSTECSGNITDGEVKTCIVIYDDIPPYVPPPPPPPPAITIGAWQEATSSPP